MDMSRRLRDRMLRLPFLAWMLMILLAALRIDIAGAAVWRRLSENCKNCLREPVEVDYFDKGKDSEPPRVNWASLEDFGKVAFDDAARWGKVLLIENASVGTALAGWTCERFAEEFPDGKMRREYDWNTNPDDNNIQKVGTQSWISVAIAGEEAKKRLDVDPDAPPYAPFYWGVREYNNRDVGSRKVVEKVRKLIADSVPKFMSSANAQSLFENAEFWLGANGTGARAHMDSHCISTLSTVLSGERRWRVGPPPRVPKGAGRSANGEVVFDDGVAYEFGWRPMFEFTARAGDAVLFPPGWIHETLNTAEGCTVALTTQFTVPLPVRYWRSYYDRTRKVGDLNPCWRQIRGIASAGKSSKKVPKDDATALKQAERIFQERGNDLTNEEKDFFDNDADGFVSRDEFVNIYVSWAASERAIRAEKPTQNLRPDMSLNVPGDASEEL